MEHRRRCLYAAPHMNPSTAELILGEEPNLRRVARRHVRCQSDVDDLVQETLLKAYGARRRFRPGTSMRAWTTTILHNHFFTLALRGRRHRVQTDTDAGSPIDAVPRRYSPPDEDVKPTLASLADHLDEDVKRALERVPKTRRTCFLLAAVLDLSSNEIARAIGIPRGTALSRIHRAREQLRGDLARHRRAPRGFVAQRA